MIAGSKRRNNRADSGNADARRTGHDESGSESDSRDVRVVKNVTKGM